MKRDEFDRFAEQTWTQERSDCGPERSEGRGAVPSPEQSHLIRSVGNTALFPQISRSLCANARANLFIYELPE